MFSSSPLRAVAALSLASHVSAHMWMNTPFPFSNTTIDNGPLTGMAQWPCKINYGFEVVAMNNMAIGETQKLTFRGSAIHGGGTCQLSVSTDKIPTPDSQFKVIKSFEGGCPGADAGPLEFDFTLPPEIPNGEMSFAWSWFSLQAGQGEMYMNCAPITVTGSSASATDIDSLPDLFIANVAGKNDCKLPSGTLWAFPNPGKDLVKAPGSRSIEPITDPACLAQGGGSPAPPTGDAPPASDGGNNSGNNGEAANPGIPSAAPPAAAVPSNPGNVLAPGASSAPAAAPEPSAPSAPEPAAPSTLTTLVTITAGPTPPGAAVPTPPAAAPPAASAAPPASPPAASPPATPPAPGTGASPTCTSPGQIVCNGPSQFGLCDHGSIQWQPVAAGMACVDGAMVASGGAGAKRFRRAHKRQMHEVARHY